MAKQSKTKYPLEREKTSKTFAENAVTVDAFNTHPRLMITIGGEHTPELISDLQNAVDEVLKHHNK